MKNNPVGTLAKQLLVLASAIAVSTSASAATTWGVADFLDGANAGTLTAKSITAWSTTGNSNTTFQSACIHNWGSAGFGIVNTAENDPCTGDPGTGPHSADNVGNIDLFLIEFNSAVNLTGLQIGWNGTDNYSADSDISVLAFTGKSPLTPSVSGLTASNLTTKGWLSIGNYADVGSKTNNSQAISTATSSSWWLVSAYNSNLGGGTNLSAGNDYFKLLSVAGNVTTTNKTPEPGSLALASLGLLGMLALRRRNKTA